MKLFALAVVGAVSYEVEWREFQEVHGARNGDIPQAFKDTVDLVEKHNSEESNYKLSYLGPFADKTVEEYKQVLGYKPKSLHDNLPRLGTHVHSGAAAADAVDWTTKGVVSEVKDQGQCGSCWAFSTTGSTESAWAIATTSLVRLSEQQLMDCSAANHACQGGNMDSAFEFYESQIIATEESYSYSGIARNCSTGGWETAIPRGGVTGYKDVKDESDLLDAVSTVGPVSVAIEADQASFQHYSSGVLTGDCGTNLDHGVLVVGYGTMDGVDYWKVKNSWGVGWGVDGFLYIQRGADECGIADLSSYPIVDSTAPPTPAPPGPPVPAVCPQERGVALVTTGMIVSMGASSALGCCQACLSWQSMISNLVGYSFNPHADSTCSCMGDGSFDRKDDANSTSGLFNLHSVQTTLV